MSQKDLIIISFYIKKGTVWLSIKTIDTYM